MRDGHWSLFGAIFTATFIVYASTSFPSVTGGDAGELLAEACQLGVAHPPGYPLFLLLNHLAMRVAHATAPGVAGAPAAAANLLSCGFGAAAAAFAALTVQEWSGSRLGAVSVPEAATAGGVAAAALFALSPLTWEYATGSEVFALNNALLAALLWLTAKVATAMHADASVSLPSRPLLPPDRRSPWAVRAAVALPWARAGALVCGLALANQHTALLFVVPLVVAVVTWLAPAAQSSPAAASPVPSASTWASAAKAMASADAASFAWALASLAFVFALGLSPYLYLVAAARDDGFGGGAQPGAWGATGTLAGFWKHVSRGEYGTFTMLTFGAKADGKAARAATESGGARAVLWLQDASAQTGGAAPALAAVSVAAALGAGVWAAGQAWWAARARGAAGAWRSEAAAPLLQGSAPSHKKGKGKTGKALAPNGQTAANEAASPLLETSLPGPSAHGQVALALVATLACYTLVWNGVFSNLPLTSSPMARAVHARFWMQPNLLLAVTRLRRGGNILAFCKYMHILFTRNLKALISRAHAPFASLSVSFLCVSLLLSFSLASYLTPSLPRRLLTSRCSPAMDLLLSSPRPSGSSAPLAPIATANHPPHPPRPSPCEGWRPRRWRSPSQGTASVRAGALLAATAAAATATGGPCTATAQVCWPACRKARCWSATPTWTGTR
jgi:hypothetical protein